MPEEAKRLEARIYRAGAHPQGSEYKEASFWSRALIDRSNAQIEYKEYKESLVSFLASPTQHEISLRVAKPVRLYIHRLLDSGLCHGLSHESVGEDP
jgi:hypothetical protein